MTSYHAIDQGRAWLGPGDWALIIGIGGLGHLGLQVLKATTAARVVVIDIDAERLELARSLGADATVLSSPDAAADVLALTDAVSVAYDFVGRDSTLALAASVVQRAGAIVIVGVGDGHVPLVADMLSLGAPLGYPIVRADTHVIRSYAGSKSDLLAVLELARMQALHVTVQPFTLDDAPAALARLAAGDVVGRAVMQPDQSSQ